MLWEAEEEDPLRSLKHLHRPGVEGLGSPPVLQPRDRVRQGRRAAPTHSRVARYARHKHKTGCGAVPPCRSSSGKALDFPCCFLPGVSIREKPSERGGRADPRAVDHRLHHSLLQPWQQLPPTVGLPMSGPFCFGSHHKEHRRLQRSELLL